MMRVIMTALLLLSLSCCSSSPEPRTSRASQGQTITVNTPGVEGAMCIVQNGSASWNIPAPGPITIPKTTAPLTINCFKGEHLRGSAQVAASFAAAEAGRAQGCVTCRYPGIIEVALRLNDSMMDVPVIRQMP